MKRGPLWWETQESRDTVGMVRDHGLVDRMSHDGASGFYVKIAVFVWDTVRGMCLANGVAVVADREYTVFVTFDNAALLLEVLEATVAAEKIVRNT